MIYVPSWRSQENAETQSEERREEWLRGRDEQKGRGGGGVDRKEDRNTDEGGFRVKIRGGGDDRWLKPWGVPKDDWWEERVKKETPSKFILRSKLITFIGLLKDHEEMTGSGRRPGRLGRSIGTSMTLSSMRHTCPRKLLPGRRSKISVRQPCY